MRSTRAVVAALVISVAGLAAGCTTGHPSNAALYVALGDSYTAAPLVPTQQVITVSAGCMQSDHNYPHVVATHVTPLLSDASCSGATTDNMTNAQVVTPGVNAPQFDRLTAQTQLVTLGIGGNDIGFAEVAATCATLGLADASGSPCRDQYVAGDDDTISDRITALGPKLTAVLDGIHTRAPSAKVFVVGYPAILPDTGDGCYPTMPIAAGDVPYLRAKEIELNAAVQQAAVAHGDVYVDTYTPSIGHDACQANGVKWVEPVVPTQPAAPVHPNADGEAGMANAVVAAMAANGVSVH